MLFFFFAFRCLVVYLFHPLAEKAISDLLFDKCREGAMYVGDMEQALYQLGFIPEVPHMVSPPDTSLNHNSAFQTDSNEGNPQTLDGHDPVQSDHLQTATTRTFKPSYSMLELEKLLLQAVSAVASDGNSTLDALAYFLTIPVKDLVFVRYLLQLL